MKITRYQDSTGHIHFAADGKRMTGDLFGKFTVTNEPADVRKLLAPLVPAAILCIGANYRRHIEETKAKVPEYPVLFMKQPAAVQNPGDPVLLPRHLRSDEVDYECELAIIIGQRCKNVAKTDALKYVLGYTAANDISARDWQKQKGGSQWCRGKTFDTFCPLGPCITTADEIPDPNALRLSMRINGEVRQDWNTNDMLFNVPTLIEFLSGSMTLMPGTVILTGTPHGVGMAFNPPKWLKAGDIMTVEIEKIGQLTNPVQEEK